VPEDRQRAVENARKTLEAGNIRNIEYTMLRKDGSRFAAELNAAVVKNAGGDPMAFMGVVRDITERKQAEEELRESEQKYRDLVENISDAIYTVDKDGILTYVSPAMEPFVEYDSSELIGRHFSEFIYQEDLPRLREAFRSILSGHITTNEYRAVTKSGQVRWMRTSSRPIFVEERVVGVQGVLTDITERMQAEEALRRRAEELDALQATVLDITAPNDLPTLLHTIVERAAALLGAPSGGMYICDPVQRQTRCVVSYNTLSDYTGTVLKYGEGAAGIVAQTGKSFIIDDYRVWSERAAVYEEDQPFTAVLTVPMIWQDNVIGSIHVLNDVESERFTQADLDLLTLFANHAAIAVENARLYEQAHDEIAERKRVEESLRIKDDAMASSIGAIAIAEFGGNLTYANDSFLRMWGYDADDEVVGKPAAEFWQTEVEGWRVIETVRNGEGWIGEMTAIRKDGSSFDVHLSANVVTDETGQPTYMMASFLDITERKRTEERLRLLSSSVEQSTEGIAVSDLEGNLLFVNNAFATLHGYEPEELFGKHLSIFHTEEQLPSVEAVNRQIKETGAFGGEVWHVRRDGTEFPTLMHNSLLRDEAGEATGMVATLRDITESKLAQERLRESEERLQLALEAANDGLFDWNLQTGKAYFSPRYYTMLGYEPYEMPASSETWMSLLHPDDRELAADLARDYREKRRDRHEMEFRLRGKVGEWRWILSRGRVTETDEDGNPVRIVGTHANITERKRLEQEIEERRLYLESVLASAPDAIVSLDAWNNVLEWNPGAEKLYGYTQEEVVGRNIDELIVRPGADEFQEAVDFTRQALAGEIVPATETIRYRKDGSPVNVILTGSPIFLRDEMVGVVAIYTDITERKRAEEAIRQQDQLAAVGQLAGGIAHDFNNLLTTIMLYAQMPLGREELPPIVTRALETILGESRQASRLVQQILDFSRRSPIETLPIDLANSVGETFRVLHRTIPENISLMLKVEPGEYVVNADPTRVQQMLVNLVVNARDAMPEGGVLDITLSRIEIGPGEPPPVAEMPSGEWVCLSVSDTGVGIPAEVLPHIFEPFYTTKPRGQGTGLGLAQVYGIVGQHGGYIRIDTEMGSGTTFHVYLPVYHVEQGEMLEEEQVVAIPRGQGEIILLVEDNEKIQEAGKEILETLGYQVLVAANGREGVEVYQSAERVDLVLTDLVMPEMSGAELVEVLKEVEPNLKALAITGYVLVEDLQGLKEAGISDVVYKPFNANVLGEVVRNALDAE
jgi:PAS domain S-box-containing protein